MEVGVAGDRVLEFALTSLVIELTPGPNMAYLAATAIAQGRRRAFAAVAGVALGLAIVGVVAALGLAAIVDRSRIAYEFLRYAGAIYLFWLAWEAWRQPSGDAGGADDFASFRRGLITNLLNPKAAAFYVIVLPAFVQPERGSVVGQNLLLAAIYVAIATAVHAGIAAAGDGLGRVLRSPERERVVRRALAVALAAVAAWLFIAARR